MRSIPYDQATDQQLKVFATNLDLTFAANIGRDNLMKKIKAVHQGDTIDLPERAKVEDSPPRARSEQEEQEDEVAKVAARRARRQQISGQGSDMVIVRIHSSELEGGDEPVDLHCNGKSLWIPRDIWCRIRIGYFNALKDAKEEKYEQKKDPATGHDIIDPVPRVVKRFNWEIWNGAGDPPGEQVHECNESSRQAELSKPAKSRRHAA